MIYKTQHR